MTDESKTKKSKYKKKQKINERYLFNKYQFKTRREFHESEEYIDGIYDKDGTELMRKLDDKEREWLNKFNKEQLCATFDTSDKEIKEGKESEDFHTDIQTRKKIRNENYARNNDLYNQKRITGYLKKLDADEYDKISETRLSGVDLEDYMVSQIDLKDKLQSLGYFDLRDVDNETERRIRDIAVDFDPLPVDKQDLIDND